MASKKNTKGFEFGDTSIKFERPIENINNEPNNEQQTSFEQKDSNIRNKSKKDGKTNRTITRVDRFAE